MLKDLSMLKGLGRKFIVVAVFGVLLGANACAGLGAQINAIVSGKNCKHADVTIHVINAKTGKTVYQRNSSQQMVPASNMKILTSAAALAYLGPDYQFETKLAMLGDTLVVIGSGDPLLGDADIDLKYNRSENWLFDDIAETLKQNNITKISGIIIDSTVFDDERVHPSWPVEQLNQPYACEVAGLNYNMNCISMTVKKVGSSAKVYVKPATNYLNIVNQVRITNSGSSAAGAYRTQTPNKLIVRGKCRTATGFDVAIERPAMLFGTLLKERLQRTEIRVSGSVVEKYVKAEADLKILKTYTTSLKDVLEVCNKESLNLAAEALVKTISAEKTDGKINGQWKHGLTLVGRYLNSLFISQSDFSLDDGSGLSRKNLVTTKILTKVLGDVYNSPTWPMYKQTLSVAGVDGTTAKYFQDDRYKGKIYGKTGYINGIRAYSGVAETPNGDYIFSILTKGGSSTVRTGINDIAKAIINYAP